MKHVVSLVLSVLALVAMASVVVACGSDDGETATDEDTATGSDGGGESFVGQWQLADGTLDGDPIPMIDGYRITMTLGADGSIGGTAACNSYGGTYDLDGSSITIGELSWTEMGCEPAVMESEAAFLAGLQRQVQLARSGTELTMTGDGAELRFSEVPPVEPAELIGTTWVLDTIIDGDTASSVQGEPTLFLDADGTFSATTGCRDLGGSYLIDGDALMFPEMRADGDCPEQLQRQDSSVISVLENARVDIDGTRLTLSAAGNEGLGYRAG